MIDPFAFIRGRSFWTVKSRPFTLTSKVWLNCSGVIAPSGANEPVPALARRTSRQPRSALGRLEKSTEIG